MLYCHRVTQRNGENMNVLGCIFILFVASVGLNHRGLDEHTH